MSAKRSSVALVVSLALLFLIVLPGNFVIQTVQAEDGNSVTPTELILTPSPSMLQTFTIRFEKGWNLFSVPFPYGARIAESTCDDSTVWGYANGKYVSEGIGLAEGTTILIYNEGFWNKQPSACYVKLEELPPTLTTPGLAVEPPVLAKGWNLIGAPSEKTAFDLIETDCNVLKGPYAYDAKEKKWVKSDYLEPGKGYFLKMAEGGCFFNPKRLKSGRKVWVSIQPKQCGENIWEKVGYPLAPAGTGAELSEKSAFLSWLSMEGIDVFNSFDVPAKPGTVTCEACSCPRGDTWFVLINSEDLSKAKSLGFSESEHPSAFVSDGGTCKSLGGEWLDFRRYCNLPTGDGGESCKDSSECQSDCLLNELTDKMGSCSNLTTNLGCRNIMEDYAPVTRCAD